MTSSPTGSGGSTRSRERSAGALRHLMAELRAQPRVGDQITGDDLRHRQAIFISVRRDATTRQWSRQRHLWPVLRSRLPDGRDEVARLVEQKRGFEETLIEFRWFGDRDTAVNDITDRFLDQLGGHLDTEADLVARLRTIVTPAGIDEVEARAAQAAHFAPQRPHPNLPATPLMVALLFTPVALFDRILDAAEFGPSGS